VNDIEYRLREAFLADADTIGPKDLRPLPRRLSPGRPDRSGLRPAARFVIPLAAAAAVAAIAIAAAVAPKLASSHHAARGTSAAPPRFIVASAAIFRGKAGHFRLETISTVTGKVAGGVLRLPHGRTPVAVAAFGAHGRFVVEGTRRHACSVWFYQFHLTDAGRIAGLRPLAVPEIPKAPVWQLRVQPFAASASGPIVASVTGGPCGRPREYPSVIEIHAINVATRTVTTWTLPTRVLIPAALAVSADGHLLGLTGFADSSYWTKAWTVPTSSAAGPLQKRWHNIVVRPRPPVAAFLSPDGKVMITASFLQSRVTHHFSLLVSRYLTATGRRLSMRRLFETYSGLIFSLDRSGRYLLIEGSFQLDGTIKHMAMLNLATGRAIAIPDAIDYAGSLAW